MNDLILSWVETFVMSPIFFPALAVFVIGDCLFPLLPSESVINLAGAWSGSHDGKPWVWGIFIAATIYGMIGDNILYFAGRMFADKVSQFPKGSKPEKALRWAKRNVRNNDVAAIIIGRFIPWARWVLTLFLGSTRYPWRKFFPIDTIGMMVWAGQATLVGYVGGWLFQRQPLIGLVTGLVAGGIIGTFLQWFLKRGVAEA